MTTPRKDLYLRIPWDLWEWLAEHAEAKESNVTAAVVAILEAERKRQSS